VVGKARQGKARQGKARQGRRPFLWPAVVLWANRKQRERTVAIRKHSVFELMPRALTMK
jgi:hypothetical protein